MKTFSIPYNTLRAAAEFASKDKYRNDLNHVHVRLMPSPIGGFCAEVFATDGRTIYGDRVQLTGVGIDSEETILFPTAIVSKIATPKKKSGGLLTIELDGRYVNVVNPRAATQALRFLRHEADWFARFYNAFPKVGNPIAATIHHVNPAFIARIDKCRRLLGNSLSYGIQMTRVASRPDDPEDSAVYAVRFPAYSSAIVVIMPLRSDAKLDGYPVWLNDRLSPPPAPAKPTETPAPVASTP